MKRWLGIAAYVFLGSVVMFGLAAIFWYEHLQAQSSASIKKIAPVTTEFRSNNVLQAEEVRSTVYLPLKELTRFAPKATTTFVVLDIEHDSLPPNSLKLRNIWAFLEVPGATTPYGAVISSQPPKGQGGKYDFRLDSCRIEPNKVVMVWKPYGLQGYRMIGGAIGFPCIILGILAIVFVPIPSVKKPSR